MHPIENIMNCVVRLQVSLLGGGIATGTGFSYRFETDILDQYIPVIITNKHVISDADFITLPINI